MLTLAGYNNIITRKVWYGGSIAIEYCKVLSENLQVFMWGSMKVSPRFERTFRMN